MTDITDLARAALDGNGEPGMYDDYDQACLWSGIVRELLVEVKRLRFAYAHADCMCDACWPEDEADGEWYARMNGLT